MSTIAEANLNVTQSIFVRSRQRSTTYELKRSSDVVFPFHVDQQFTITWITGERICLHPDPFLSALVNDQRIID